MNSYFILISSILYLSSVLPVSHSVLCYQCTYIGGLPDFSSNHDCVDYLDNVPSTSVYIKEGVACMKAEGTVRGQYFVIRRALQFGYNEEGELPNIPFGKGSVSCSGLGDNGPVGQGPNTAVIARAIGDSQVNVLTSCLICKEDECNAGHSLPKSILILFVPFLSYILLT